VFVTSLVEPSVELPTFTRNFKWMRSKEKKESNQTEEKNQTDSEGNMDSKEESRNLNYPFGTALLEFLVERKMIQLTHIHKDTEILNKNKDGVHIPQKVSKPSKELCGSTINSYHSLR